nr:hypothetical protein [Tanacetum cinerariifolium]
GKAAESFASFSQALAELKRNGGSNATIDLMNWNLGTAQTVGITQASSANQDPSNEANKQAENFRNFATLLMQEGRQETQQTGPA